MKRFSHPRHPRSAPNRVRRFWLRVLGGLVCSLAVTLAAHWAAAQSNDAIQKRLEKQEEQLIEQYSIPEPAPPPVYQAKPEPIAPAAPPIYQPEPELPEDAPVYEPQPPAPPPPEAAPPPDPDLGEAESDFDEIQQEIDPEAEFLEEEEAEPEEIAPSDYILQFDRAPAVGDRLRLTGLYDQSRLGFTRPQNWKLNSIKALIRFQHSPALIAIRSNLTVQINGTSVGSIPLNRTQGEIGNALFEIPLNRIRDYNEISIVVQQHNTDNCELEDSEDPTLWTEILPDSQIIFNYQPQPVRLDFSRYPYPFFDPQALEANRIAFLLPNVKSETWLAAASAYSAALGRLADYRPIDLRLVETLEEVEPNERLIAIGSPDEQPELQKLELPLKVERNQVLDSTGNPLPFDLGILMLTTAKDNSVPTLVATGNDAEGVAKAVAALVRPQDRQIMTGSALLVNRLDPVPPPSPRKWPRFLPESDEFQLKDLTAPNGRPFEDISVRGVGANPIEFDFKALPDDRFKRGSSMNLVYSYGPQTNPRTSAVEVLIDGVFVGGARLTDREGETRKTLKVDLPENLIKPNSRIQVAFRLNPREEGTCGRVTDDQLSGTLHAETSFDLERETSVELPDLQLLQYGFPLTAPQDLSSTAIVLPDSPTKTDVMVMLKFAERLGRLSQSDAIALEVYTPSTLPDGIKRERHLVGIGTQEEFPFPEVFEANDFSLGNLFERQKGDTALQPFSDNQGVVRQVISPFRGDRVLLALTGQTEAGLVRVGQMFEFDPWFFQLQGDTALLNVHSARPSPFKPGSYDLEFLDRAQKVRRIEKTSFLDKVSRFIQERWYVLPIGIVVLVLLLYGLVQLYIKRMVTLEDSQS